MAGRALRKIAETLLEIARQNDEELTFIFLARAMGGDRDSDALDFINKLFAGARVPEGKVLQVVLLPLHFPEETDYRKLDVTAWAEAIRKISSAKPVLAHLG